MIRFQIVKDIATRNIEKLSVTDTVRSATELFFTKRIHNIVIEEADQWHTVLSIAHLLDFIIHGSESSAIGTVQRTPLKTIDENAKISEAVLLMEQDGDIVGVTDALGRLYGVLTFTDVTRKLNRGDINSFSDMTIASLLLKENAATAVPGETLKEKAEELKHSPLDCIIILDGQIAKGIITKRDVLRLFKNREPLDRAVETYMSAPLFTIAADATIIRALDVMQTRQFRRAVVENTMGQYMGVITQKGVVEYLFTKMSQQLSKKTNEMLFSAVQERNEALKDYKENLEELVEKRTAELRRANEQLVEEIRRRERIEASLKQKEEELRQLNQQLEEQVSIEVENSRRKDMMIFRQSKMAAMGELISMIAHQWRQPLNGIALGVSGLKVKQGLDTLDDAFLKTKLDEMNRYIQHMSKTIDDFRNFYKPDKIRESVMLDEVVKESYKLIKSGLIEDNIVVRFTSEDFEPVMSFRNELIQVFLNVLKNAWDALAEKKVPDPRIDIHIFKDRHEGMTVVVRDNAGGIPQTLLEQIFDPYFSTKDRYNGTGLGLYMSRTIIEGHCRGRIEVANGDEGAVFTIVLPEVSDGSA